MEMALGREPNETVSVFSNDVQAAQRSYDGLRRRLGCGWLVGWLVMVRGWFNQVLPAVVVVVVVVGWRTL